MTGRVRSAALAAAALLASIAAAPAAAERPLPDYGFVRGVNHGLTGDLAVLERDLGYARRVNLNSTRIWLDWRAWEADPAGYAAKLVAYVRTAHRLGFSTMPILFNGNGLDPATLRSGFVPRGEAFVRAMVSAVGNEPGLLMWDVMNEPFTNDYHDRAPVSARTAREAEVTRFLRHFLTFTRRVDGRNALTVGYTFSSQLEPTADLVDVLSFHDYTDTRAKVEDAYRIAEAVAKRVGKPVMNTETGCIARANPYDEVIQIAAEHRTGFYLFNLIIAGRWGQIHGIFYPDGTVRDPSTVAALMGFYRKRDPATMVAPRADREGSARAALREIAAALGENPDSFTHSDPSVDAMLDDAEHAANLLEAAEAVPMAMPPTARILAWRAQPAAARDREAIRQFTYQLGLDLKRAMLLYR